MFSFWETILTRIISMPSTRLVVFVRTQGRCCRSNTRGNNRQEVGGDIQRHRADAGAPVRILRRACACYGAPQLAPCPSHCGEGLGRLRGRRSHPRRTAGRLKPRSSERLPLPSPDRPNRARQYTRQKRCGSAEEKINCLKMFVPSYV